MYTDTYFMKQALNEAQKAFDMGEIPIGCVVVCNNVVIGKGHNLTELLHDVTAHAEMQAITAAANYLGAKYLNECTLYVTIEPCIMCAGAIYWSQLAKLVFGARDEKRGFMNEGKHLLHPKTEVLNGIMAVEASKLMRSFFKQLR
ncbi:MAG: nucleoside deaminase [Bacteroidia bacterium]|nr:nucleoside deaminase [Bacteroidia bacterium]